MYLSISYRHFIPINKTYFMYYRQTNINSRIIFYVCNWYTSTRAYSWCITARSYRASKHINIVGFTGDFEFRTNVRDFLDEYYLHIDSDCCFTYNLHCSVKRYDMDTFARSIDASVSIKLIVLITLQLLPCVERCQEYWLHFK